MRGNVGGRGLAFGTGDGVDVEGDGNEGEMSPGGRAALEGRGARSATEESRADEESATERLEKTGEDEEIRNCDGGEGGDEDEEVGEGEEEEEE